MKNKLTLLIVFCLCVQSMQLLAQRKADQIIPFDQSIETILLNPFTGSVIVKEKDAVQSYDPESNKIEWKITKAELVKTDKLADAIEMADMGLDMANGDFSKLMESKKDEIRFIPNSPFVSLNIEGIDIIINSTDGKVVFNSGNLGYRLLQSEYMPYDKAFLLTVVNKNQYGCVYYDLVLGTQKWMTELASMDSFLKSLSGLLTFWKESDNPQDKVFTTDNNIFASINGTLYNLAKNDGKLLWQTDFRVTDFILSDNLANVITMRKSGNLFSSKVALNLLDANTGNKLWKDDITTKYISYIEDAGDKVLVAHASGFNFYSYADGKKVWKKDAKGNKIKQVIPVGDDYLYVADKEMNLIDKNGANKWKKFIEICDNDEDEVYYLGKVDNNRVFYLTDTYGNMVDYTTGKKIWKKNIEFDKKRPLLYSYDDNKNVYLAYNDKKLYRFHPNAKSEDKPEAFAKLKEIKDDKTMSNIELFDWGVSLVGENDVIGVSFDGETKYHRIYKDPGAKKRNMFAIGRTAATLGATALAGSRLTKMMGNMMTKGEPSTADKAAIGGASLMAGIVNDSALDKYEQRLLALKANNEYAFVMDKAEGGGVQLVKVRKSDGEEVDKILVDGERPVYEVDPVSDNVYYVKGKEMWIYSRK